MTLASWCVCWAVASLGTCALGGVIALFPQFIMLISWPVDPSSASEFGLQFHSLLFLGFYSYCSPLAHASYAQIDCSHSFQKLIMMMTLVIYLKRCDIAIWFEQRPATIRHTAWLRPTGWLCVKIADKWEINHASKYYALWVYFPRSECAYTPYAPCVFTRLDCWGSAPRRVTESWLSSHRLACKLVK